jgi:neutral ceramidase
MKQVSYGIHTRIYARSYIITDKITKKTVLYINTDIQGCSSGIKEEVVKKLKKLYTKYDYDNVCISAGHNHK